MATTTPGPWKWCGDSRVARTIHEGPTHDAIEEVCLVSDSKHHDGNAALIAAAPAMLDVLRECVTQEGAACWRNRDYAERRIRYIDKIARAAIATAEGR